MSDSCNPMDCNPPGLSVQRIFQARSLEWVAMSFSKESSQPRDWTRASELSLLWASWHNRCPNMNVLGKFCTVPKQSRREGCDGGAGICIIPPTTSSVWACTGGTCLFQEHSLTFFFFFFWWEGWSYFIEELWERVKGLMNNEICLPSPQLHLSPLKDSRTCRRLLPIQIDQVWVQSCVYIYLEDYVDNT